MAREYNSDNRDSRGGSRGASSDFKRNSNSRVRRTRRKVCQFCVDKVDAVDYTDVPTLRKYITDRGKILPRRITGNCAKHQRALTVAVKRARQIAILPYVVD